MKIKLSRKLKQMASALLVTMVLGGLLCMLVMYYLALIEQQNTLSVRSQAWNIAIAVSEAGIEEGLQALNQNRTPGVPVSLYGVDGWHYDGAYYWRTNTDSALGGNWYIIRVNLTDPLEPQLICRSYVTLPALAANEPNVFFAAVGVTTGPGVISRAIRVHCWDRGMFLAAMVAKHKIDLKGNGILTDSFHSKDLWKSDFGQYDPSVYAGDRGDIASNDGVVSTISVGNANIYGKAHTGAEGTVTIGPGGAVGTHAWQNAGNTGFQEGYVLRDANFTFPDTGLPYSSGLPLGGPATIVTVTYDITRTSTTSTVYPDPAPWSGVTTTFLTTPTTTSDYPAPGTYVGEVTINYPGEGSSEVEKTYSYDYITGTEYTYMVYQTNAVFTTNSYDHVIEGGDYYTTEDLHGRTLVTGIARLVLPNGLVMAGNDQFTIAPGGSLKMYVGSDTCTVGTVAGNGILNLAGYAENFILECTPEVKNFNFYGNGEFIGVLVAPEAHMTMNGGGHEDIDIIGSVMMNSITLNGHFSFHYDEALEALNNNPRLLVKSWDEIK